jgi:hypothetical protein
MFCRVFLKKIALLIVFAGVLAGMGVSTYVYADRFVWTYITPTEESGFSTNPGDFQAVAISEDGNIKIGVKHNSMYRSVDGGTFDEVNLSNFAYIGYSPYGGSIFQDVAISGSGQYGLATATFVHTDEAQEEKTGGIYTTSNSGQTWNMSSSVLNFNDTAVITDVDITSSGSNMVAITNIGSLYYYVDSVWSEIDMETIATDIAVVGRSGSLPIIYFTSDSNIFVSTSTTGIPFFQTLNPSIDLGEFLTLSGIDTSNDGQTIAVISGSTSVYVSRDAGETFSLVESTFEPLKSISVSGDGNTIIAMPISKIDAVRVSIDGGVTFSSENSLLSESGVWNSIAVSSDGYSAIAVSSDSYIFIGYVDTIAPSVTFTNPGADAYVKGTVTVSATASDTGGSGGISSVTFRNATDNQTISVDTVSPYSTDWNTTPLSEGFKTLQAVAVDNVGNISTTTRTVIVDKTPPAAPGIPNLISASDTGTSSTDNITSIGNPTFTVSCISGYTVKLWRNYSDEAGTSTCMSDVATVTDSVYGVTSGYAYIFDFTATQLDYAGNESVMSDPLEVTIDRINPAVSVTSPVQGFTASTTLTLSATASDTHSNSVPSTVRGVQFVIGDTPVGSLDTSSPYTLEYDLTNASWANGSQTIYAIATDYAGNSAVSSVSGTIDTLAPSAVDFIDLEEGDTISGSDVELIAEVTDNYSIAGVLFKIDDDLIGEEDTSAATSSTAVRFYNTLDTTAYDDGEYTLSIIARDELGNTTTESISVTIENSVPPPPSDPDPEDDETEESENQSDAQQSVTPGSYSGGGSSSGTSYFGGTPIQQIIVQGVVQNNTNQNNTNPVSPNVAQTPTQAEASNRLEANGIPENFRFTRNLELGDSGQEVSELQKMLNIMGYNVASSGQGSIGQETNIFGQRTRLALIGFQRAFSIVATGFFGPDSRNILNTILDLVRH